MQPGRDDLVPCTAEMDRIREQRVDAAGARFGLEQIPGIEDEDMLPHEHEQQHRALVNKLIEGGLIKRKDVYSSSHAPRTRDGKGG